MKDTIDGYIRLYLRILGVKLRPNADSEAIERAIKELREKKRKRKLS